MSFLLVSARTAVWIADCDVGEAGRPPRGQRHDLEAIAVQIDLQAQIGLQWQGRSEAAAVHPALDAVYCPTAPGRR